MDISKRDLFKITNLNANMIDRLTNSLMKNILIVLLTVASIGSQAQGFEGIMKWRIKMEITDPMLKEKMGEAQQSLNDPAMQAKMKEMQAQMNNPQLKAMLDANPQLKAQMEKMMSGGGIPGAGSSMATNLTLKFKNGNALTVLEGGMMGGMEILYLKEKNQSYRLDRANKTWSALSDMSAPANTTKPSVKVTKTSETMIVLNYVCTKYVVDVSEENGRKSSQIFWATADMKDIDLKSLSQQRMGMSGNNLYYDQIEGTPLRIELNMPEGILMMQVAEIKKEILKESEFIIPADFQETKGMVGGKN
jgi:hypothetical protein